MNALEKKFLGNAEQATGKNNNRGRAITSFNVLGLREIHELSVETHHSCRWVNNGHLPENCCTVIRNKDFASRRLDPVNTSLTILSMPLGPSDVRTASLTARAADRFERRTSSGLSEFLNARTLVGRAEAV